jgi:hypothetical protein
MKFASSDARNSAAFATSQAAHTEFGILDGDLLSERDHRRLGRLVGHVGILLPGGDRGDRDDDARALRAHHRQDVLAGHDGAAQVDGRDAVECRLGDLGERRVAAGDAHADIVVQHIDAAPTLPCSLDHRRERRLLGDVSLKRNAFPARLARHGHRFLGGGKIVVDGEHLRSLLSEAQHGGAAVADALARRLASADNDGDLVFETHGVLDCIDAALKLTEIRRRTRALRAALIGPGSSA